LRPYVDRKIRNDSGEDREAATDEALGDITPKPGSTTRRRGRNPGDGAKNDGDAMSRMFELIKSGQARSPTAAGRMVAQANREPAANAHRRLAKKFTRKYESQRQGHEPWGDVCR
jgi:hypothetical protein